MVQLRLLSGPKAGAVYRASGFPWRVGRGESADLRLEEPGVWDQHLQVDLIPGEGFVVTRQGQAMAAINGHLFDRRVLRNGDLIEIGALKFRFWLAEARQKRLYFREWMAWGGVILLSLLEIVVIHLML
jgi:pSer/pThr/pTyr-binding forkhead associated (FHA) protein